MELDAIGTIGAAAGVRPFNEVLVPLDGTRRAERALGTASELARSVGATLRLVLVAPDPHLGTYLERTAAGLDIASETELIISTEHPATHIAALAHASGDRSIVVMASHARTRLTGALLGTTAGDVVRSRSGPVVVVGPRCHKTSAGFDTLVVPLDGSGHAEAALPLAATWARAMGLSIVLVSVGALFPWPPSEPDDYRLRRLAHELWTEGLDVHVATSEEGTAADGILRHVRRARRPLVAMSTHAREGIDALMTMSVTTTVVRWSSAPVVVLYPAGE